MKVWTAQCECKSQVMSQGTTFSFWKLAQYLDVFANPQMAMLADVDKRKIRQTMNEPQHKRWKECAK